MFLINLTYCVELSVVDQYLAAHRNYLDGFFKNKQLLMAGPKDPRTGGIIIALTKDRAAVEKFVQQDPYSIHKIATFEIIPFNPLKFHPELTNLLTQSNI